MWIVIVPSSVHNEVNVEYCVPLVAVPVIGPDNVELALWEGEALTEVDDIDTPVIGLTRVEFVEGRVPVGPASAVDVVPL